MKALIATFILVLPACAIVNETHYLEKRIPGKDPNVYRIKVNGFAAFSAARYVAGNYDSRAVDLFFNEVSATTPEGKLIRPFVSQDEKEPGTDDKLKPYSPDDAHKTFVMLLSTNVKAVTDTIGQFAENQLAADALTNLLQRDEVRTTESESHDVDGRLAHRAGVASDLAALMAAPAPASDTKEALRSKYLRVLNAIAAAQGNSQVFDTFAAAKAWFDAQPK